MCNVYVLGKSSHGTLACVDIDFSKFCSVVTHWGNLILPDFFHRFVHQFAQYKIAEFTVVQFSYSKESIKNDNDYDDFYCNTTNKMDLVHVMGMDVEEEGAQ